MIREKLHDLVDIVDEKEIETVYKVLLKFVAEDAPQQDEIQAIATARKEIAENRIIPHNKIF